MPIDGRQFTRDDFQTGVCIIGAGAAGITVALTLMDRGIDVCLVESGDLQADAETQRLAGGDLVGRPYANLETTRQRSFGGTTNRWSGWCRPLDDIDFRPRSWIPHSGWPIGLQDLEDYYVRAQALCQVGPYAYSPDAFELPRSERWNLDNARIVNRMIQFSPPTRFGTVYWEDLVNADNVTVFLNSNVLRINTNESGDHATEIDVGTLSGKRFKIRADYVVVAAGGLENARLLLLSDSVQRHGIGNDFDLVGRYFMNHYYLQAGAIVGNSAGHGDAFYTRGDEITAADGRKVRVRGYLTFTAEAQESERLVSTSFNLSSSDLSSVFLEGREHDRWYSGIGRVVSNFDELVIGSYYKVKSSLGESRRPPIYEIINIVEQTPNPNSRVTLTAEQDALGQRKLRLDWELNDIDLESVERSHRLLGAEIARLGIGRVVMPLDAAEGWPHDYIGDWHHIGTTRMHADPREGVVDANCAVHGVPNLFVAGSSVFTTAGYANPTLTIVALAVRLADHIGKKVAAEA